MILTASKLSTTMVCWKKAFNSYIRGFRGEPSYGLVDGSAFHHGVAVGMASKDWVHAIKEAKENFEKEAAMRTTLPGDEFLHEDHKDLVTEMLQLYALAFEGRDYEVIQPECKFNVELPNSRHPDPQVHWLEYDGEKWVEKWNFWGLTDAVEECKKAGKVWRLKGNYISPPSQSLYGDMIEELDWREDKMDPEKVLRKEIASAHPGSSAAYLRGEHNLLSGGAKSCLCWQPHRLRGITDAIISWKQNIWLQEHKTTTFLGSDFWSEFQLDIQPTAYLYGIKRATGIQPRGVIVNAVCKPTEKQVSAWNSRRKDGGYRPVKDYLKFDIEAFTRTDEDIARFEREVKDWADEFVQRLLTGKFPMSNTRGVCSMWHRTCDYHSLCLNHDSPEQLEVFKREKLVQVERRKEVGGKW